MNHLELSTSYDVVERIDTALLQYTIEMAGFHRTPVSPSTVRHELVHGATENFNYEQNTV